MEMNIRCPHLRLTAQTHQQLHFKEVGKNLVNNESSTVCDDDYFIIENDETSRVMQLTNVRNTTDTHYVKVKDIGTGDSAQYDFDTTDHIAKMNLDGYEYQLYVPASVASAGCAILQEITDDGDKVADLWTKYGSVINITGNNSGAQYNDGASPVAFLKFKEDKDKQEEDDTIDEFGWNFSWDTAKTVADFSGSVANLGGTELSMLTLDADSKKSQGYSKFGTFFERDTNGDQDVWELTIPEEEA
jgi:hypothetical protein